MGLSDFKITDADITSKGVQASPDQLGGTAEENKKVFDRLTSGPVREGHNNLIDALIAAGVEQAVLLPENAGGFKYIRLNSDKVLEVSTDGSTWQATGSSGHLIYDKNGVQLPQRSRMKFSNSEVTDDGVYTIVNGEVATHETAGIVKPDYDFDIAADGTLSLYKALTLIASVTPAKVEQGATQTTATVKWGTNKTPVSVTVEGESVSPDTTSKELTGLQITEEKEFTVVAADSRGSQTFTAVMRFCNGVYTGAAAASAAIDSAFIRTLTKSLQSGKSKTFTVNAAAGAYIWYACPVRYGTPNFNVGGFDGGFGKVATLDYTNPSGYTEEYQVWRSDNAGLGSTTVVVI